MVPWPCESFSVDQITAAIRTLKVPLRICSVTLGPRKQEEMLVVPAASSKDFQKSMSHIDMARALGLPCGSELGTMDPTMCHWFVVYVGVGGDGIGVGVGVGGCSKSALQHGQAMYVTSFYCRSEKQGVEWCKRFLKKAATIAFERDVLAPMGLRFFLQHTGDIIA